MSLNIPPIQESGIFLKVEDHIFTLSGSIEIQEPAKVMRPFLDELHQQMINSNISAIQVNIVQLNYLNSSGIREILNWIMKLDELPEEKKYHVEFLYNPDILWQEASMSTIQFLNQKYISINKVI